MVALDGQFGQGCGWLKVPAGAKLARACGVPAFGVRAVDCWQ